MSSFLFEGAFTRLASLDAADYSNLRVALVETAPVSTDEFAADLDETAAANYARKTPTGGALTQTAGKTLVTGTIPTWSALGTAEVLTHWVLFYNTGSDATSWLIAAVSLNHTCSGGDLTISTSGFLVDPTITRAGGGTAAGTSYDPTGNTYITPAATVQAGLDAAESTFSFLATTYIAPFAADYGVEAHTGSGTYTVGASAGMLTLDLTGDLEVTLTAPAAGASRRLWVIANASSADRALSFTNDIDWMGDAPATIPSETGRLMLIGWGGGPEGSGSGWWGVDFWQLVSGGGGLSAPVALSDLATQADQTIVGNNTGGTAAPIALTASQTRTVLGLGGAALLSVGTTAGTVAAGDDSRITGAVPTSRTINGLDLTTNRSLTAADVGAGRQARFHSIDMSIPPLVTGSYTFGGTISGVNGAYMVTTSTNDQALEWDLDFDGGTWRIDFVYRATNSNGIATFSIDGSSVGTIDTYAASSTNNNYGSITGITVAAGRHTLKLSNPTKNGSSGTYYLTPQSLGLRRTGA